MKRIGIFAKRHHKDAVRLAEEVVAWLVERKIEVFVDQPLADAMAGVSGYTGRRSRRWSTWLSCWAVRHPAFRRPPGW